MAKPKRPHVLVVDDAPEILELYRELFEAEGYRVSLAAVPATDPGDVARLAPDLIVLDLVFGSEDLGLRFLGRIEHDIGIGAPPVVVVSGSRQALAAARARFAPLGVATLAKPFDVDELLQAVADRLGSSAARR